MWFKNLQIYQLLSPIGLSPEELHQRLEAGVFRPCGSLQPESMGWELPLGRDGRQLTHAVGGCVMICACRQERLLPASVVKEALDEKVAAIEEHDGRKVRRKERLQLKDELVVDLLPRAFTRSSLTYAYIDEPNGWIVIDSPTVKRAEELLSLLRETLDGLKVKPLAVREAPASVLTGWLGKGAAEDFTLLDECELREPTEDGGVIRCKRQDLASEEIAIHLDAGKQVVRLAVEWRERIGCLLCDDLVVRRLKFLDWVQDEVADTAAEDAVARFDVEFSLMSLELANFIPRLLEIYGGPAIEE